MSLFSAADQLFSSMADVLDVRQSRRNANAHRRMDKIKAIIENSSFDADKKAFESDYIKLKQTFDVSAKDILYGRRAEQ